MNNKYIFLGMLSLTACNSELDEFNVNNPVSDITMTAKDFVYDPISRTSFDINEGGAAFTWAENDTVGIFPNEGAQVYFPMIQGAGTKSAAFNGGGWALKNSAQYAAYYPMMSQSHLDKTAIPANYTHQKQIGNNSTAHLGKCDYMAATALTPESQKVNFMFNHLGCLVRLNITYPQTNKEITSLCLSSDEELFTEEGKFDLSAPTIEIIPVKKSKEFKLGLEQVITTADLGEATLYLMLPPADYSGKTVKVKIFDQQGTAMQANLELKNMEAGKAYAYSLNQFEVLTDEMSLNLSDVGLLETVFPADKISKVRKLTLSGNLNNSDLIFIRKLCGYDENDKATEGQLRALDMSECNIFQGGYYNGNMYAGRDKITQNLFMNTKIEEIILPKSLVSIDGFFGATQLRNVKMFEGLQTIGPSAFAKTGIKSITIPNSVRSIGYMAFSSCEGLTDITMPSGPVQLNKKIFADSYRLNDLVLSEGMEVLDEEALYESYLYTLTLPSTMKIIRRNQMPSTIYSYAKNPPRCDAGFPSGTVVYVPQESVQLYRQQWKEVSIRPLP